MECVPGSVLPGRCPLYDLISVVVIARANVTLRGLCREERPVGGACPSL